MAHVRKRLSESAATSMDDEETQYEETQYTWISTGMSSDASLGLSCLAPAAAPVPRLQPTCASKALASSAAVGRPLPHSLP